MLKAGLVIFRSVIVTPNATAGNPVRRSIREEELPWCAATAAVIPEKMISGLEVNVHTPMK
jgi:hypothetical protein